MFKKLSIILIIIAFFLTTFLYGCGDNKVINGTEYTTYGLLNEKDKRNSNIEYEVIWGNVIWGCLLFETIVAPIYFFGFSLFEPIQGLDKSKPKGSV